MEVPSRDVGPIGMANAGQLNLPLPTVLKCCGVTDGDGRTPKRQEAQFLLGTSAAMTLLI